MALGLTILVAVAAAALRVVLFRAGLLYGATAERNMDIVLAGCLAAAAIAIALRLVRRNARRSAAEALTLAAALLGIGTAAFGVVAFAVPGGSEQIAAPACRGVPVIGAPFYAQTVDTGVNARAGASSAYPQVNRFAGDCTLGFDGYCIGEPIPDPASQLPDTRWLIVHHRNYLISAARVRSQSPEAALGTAPAAACSSLGGLAPPAPIAFTATITALNKVKLQTSALHASLVGYAVEVNDALDGTYPYALIRVKQNTPRFDGVWLAATAAPDLPKGTGTVELAAEACLAADVPAGSPVVYLATFRDGRLATLRRTQPTSRHDSRMLAATACSGPP